MFAKMAYLGRSAVRSEAGQQTVSFAPNLAREPVAFDAPLLKPLRFREAISALHDVVISDLRFKKKDKTAYLRWRQAQAELASAARRAEVQRLAAKVAAAPPVPQQLQNDYDRLRERYWGARMRYDSYLRQHDAELWRLLVPYDPVVTVADDVVFFECFSADESSYGCLTVDRESAFGPSSIGVKLGTTNVDYSWDLYHHFQALRSYRQTRFRVDPAGFEVATAGHDDYREEKIDLPPGWLKGLMQIQAAMALPGTRLTLSREAIYSILAHLRRHREKTGPRAVRFDLNVGEPPRITLEPWGLPIASYGAPYEGPPTAPIRVWGRRRLLALARLLPLAERFDVYLLGTGLPSFWVARVGEMRLTLGLSGWTVNDWTRSSALDLVAPQAWASPDQVERVRALLQERRRASLAEVMSHAAVDKDVARVVLLQLARSGQLIHDLDAGVYRWRQILPQALGEADVEPDHPELQGAREIMARRPVKLERTEEAPGGGLVLTGHVDHTPVELLLDGDRNVKRGKCLCGYYRKYMLKNGPCRHMIVLRRLIQQKETGPTLVARATSP